MSLKSRLMFMKFSIARAIGYLTIINSGMILFLFLDKLHDKGYITFSPSDYFLPIFVIGLMGIATIGWVEVKFFKGQQEEAKIVFKRNPDMMEMKKKINLIYEKIK